MFVWPWAKTPIWIAPSSVSAIHLFSNALLHVGLHNYNYEHIVSWTLMYLVFELSSCVCLRCSSPGFLQQFPSLQLFLSLHKDTQTAISKVCLSWWKICYRVTSEQFKIRFICSEVCWMFFVFVFFSVRKNNPIWYIYFKTTLSRNVRYQREIFPGSATIKEHCPPLVPRERAENCEAIITEPHYEKSKKISNDQEPTQSDPIFCPQNQKGNN